MPFSRLWGDLPSHLPIWETIQIEQCSQLASSLPRAPAIRKLVIVIAIYKIELHEIPPSLEELRIQGREMMEVFEAITITPPISLQILVIKDCSYNISFPGAKPPQIIGI